MKFPPNEKNDKWHSVAWPYTMTTLHRSDFIPKPWPYYWTRPFTDSWEVSIEPLRWMWHAYRGRLLLLTHGPVPFGTCICSSCWYQCFSGTCHYFSEQCIFNIPQYFLDFASKLWYDWNPTNWFWVMGSKVKGQISHVINKTLGAWYRLQFLLNHFQTSIISCRLSEEPY